jgi:dihydrofolate reductase
MINIIVATCYRRGIGIKNELPWRLKGDLNYFKENTIGDNNNCVIMGKNTWNSLPKNSRPLKDRHNIIVSNSMKTKANYQISNKNNTTITSSLNEALELTYTKRFSKTWIIGGANLYDSAIRTNLIDEIHITNITNDISCDTFFPDISKDYSVYSMSDWYKENDIKYRFEIHTQNKKNYSFEQIHRRLIKMNDKYGIN